MTIFPFVPSGGQPRQFVLLPTKFTTEWPARSKQTAAATRADDSQADRANSQQNRAPWLGHGRDGQQEGVRLPVDEAVTGDLPRVVDRIGRFKCPA
jgi:hypothetical protein